LQGCILASHPKCTESRLQGYLEAGLKGCKEMAGPGGMGGTAQLPNANYRVKKFFEMLWAA
jgi:hypothetical protein